MSGGVVTGAPRGLRCEGDAPGEADMAGIVV
jgi:hypothetical protein